MTLDLEAIRYTWEKDIGVPRWSPMDVVKQAGKDIPALIKEVERARAETERLREVVYQLIDQNINLYEHPKGAFDSWSCGYGVDCEEGYEGKPNHHLNCLGSNAVRIIP